MEVIVFEKEAYYRMLSEMRNIIKSEVTTAVKHLTDSKCGEEWLQEKEAMHLLNIKSKTKMLQMRNSGQIVYSKFGRKIMYSRKSIIELITKNVVK